MASEKKQQGTDVGYGREDSRVKYGTMSGLTTDQVENVSDVDGDTDSDALDQLDADIAGLTSDDIQNLSVIPVDTVTQAIDSLVAAGGGIEGVYLSSGGVLSRYGTIALALAAAAPGDSVLLGDGDYAESFALPDAVNLIGVYAAARITGAVATGTRITVGVGCRVQSLAIDLPTDARPAVLFERPGSCLLDRIGLFGNGVLGIGIRCDGVASSLIADNITYAGGDCDIIAHCSDGRLIIGEITVLLGTANAIFSAAPGTAGQVTGLRMSPPPFVAVVDAFLIDGATLRLSSFSILASCDNGIHVSGDNHEVTLNDGTILCDVYDVLVDPGVVVGSFYMDSIRARSANISAPIAYYELLSVNLTFQDTDEFGDAINQSFGHNHIGAANHGEESAFGQGGEYFVGMLVWTYIRIGDVWDDVTQEAKSPSGSIFDLGGAVDDALYVSSDLLDSGGDYLQVTGLRLDTINARVGGTIISEYWNGAAWVEYRAECRQSDPAYVGFAKTFFERVDNEDVRFSLADAELWAKNDPMADGVDRYWLRFRVSSVLGTPPVFESARLHADTTVVGSDGFILFYGKARSVARLPWDIGLVSSAAIGPPSDQNVFLSDNLGVGREQNEFSAGSIDRIGQALFLPEDMCTACPIAVLWSFFVSANTLLLDIVWRVRWALSKDADGVYPSLVTAPATAPGEQVTSVVSPVNTQNIQYSAMVLIDVSDAIAKRSGSPGDMLWITLERDGPDGADDYTGSAYIVNLEASYSRWALGGHF